jgi:hypothetical protein
LISWLCCFHTKIRSMCSYWGTTFYNLFYKIWNYLSVGRRTCSRLYANSNRIQM